MFSFVMKLLTPARNKNPSKIIEVTSSLIDTTLTQSTGAAQYIDFISAEG